MRVTLPSGTQAELARPSSGEPRRGVVLIPDVGGLRPLFDEMCQRLADENQWVVCAPELYPGQEHLELPERFEAARSFDDHAKLADFIAAADLTGVEPVAVMGFCMGGMYCLKAAGTGRFDRAVPFYGMIRVPEAFAGPRQGQPLDHLAKPGAAEVMAIIGTADPWTPAADVDALEATGATVVRYEGAEHGFVHAPERPAHRPVDAADAWTRLATFLA